MFEVVLMWFLGGYGCGNVVLTGCGCGETVLDLVIRWRESQ